ncbi:hypothetical protein V202x_16580 [Gimesia aquarii]|uniref:Uncharacterized protein n=1 Tax=Gimesia aquarii TaxID=2527964 RepID=A0A517WSR9_9PLAN|nr:hypothetical protein V202x_16580 [Gimesia aquarii]
MKYVKTAELRKKFVSKKKWKFLANSIIRRLNSAENVR